MDDTKILRETADSFIASAAESMGVNLAYDEESLKWVDDFLSRTREEYSEEQRERLAAMVGSYLGECIIKNLGGAWDLDEYGWAVYFDEENAVYPFSKTWKHLENGPDDSIYSLYTTIPVLFNLKK